MELREKQHVCLTWSQELHERGLHPTTRFCWLVNLRTYLDWLWEHSLIAAPGRALILSRDLPQKPDYLPHPLPSVIDQELQTRLKQAGTTIALGLFVMRRTGLRVGKALSRIADRYQLPCGDLAHAVDRDPVTLVQSVIFWITKNLCEGPSGHRARLLARGLEQARDDLKELRSAAPTSVR